MHAKSLFCSLLLVGAQGTWAWAEVDSSLPAAAERSTSMLPALAVLAIMVVLRVKLRLHWEQSS